MSLREGFSPTWQSKNLDTIAISTCDVIPNGDFYREAEKTI
ncbi:MAG: hypothetical protein WCH46_10980 [bacterium]